MRARKAHNQTETHCHRGYSDFLAVFIGFISGRDVHSQASVLFSAERGEANVLPSCVARYRSFATAQTKGKSTEQLDIDKKKGALAYVPFASDFEITPLMGTAYSALHYVQITIRRALSRNRELPAMKRP